MEISRVRRSLREVEDFLDQRRIRAEQCKAWFSTLSTELTNLASTYSAVIAQINSYVPTGDVEADCKDLLAKLVSERAAFLSDVNQAVTDLGTLTEF